MIVRDVKWSLPVNMLLIECECGALFWRPAHYSAIWCKHCGRGPELWHGVDPKPTEGPWSNPEMKIELYRR